MTEDDFCKLLTSVTKLDNKQYEILFDTLRSHFRHNIRNKNLAWRVRQTLEILKHINKPDVKIHKIAD